MSRRVLMFAVFALGLAPLSTGVFLHAQSLAPGVREAAWSPDGKRLVVSWFDQLWTMAPDGKDQKRLSITPGGFTSERDAAFSPDGKTIAFAAETNGQFDVWTVPAAGGAATKVTSEAGDERWPSFTRDGRIIYAHRPVKGAWAIYTSSRGSGGSGGAEALEVAKSPRVRDDGGELLKLVELIECRGGGDRHGRRACSIWFHRKTRYW